MAEPITIKDVAQSIGWLDGFNNPQGIEFDTADWSNVDPSGVVYLSGRADDNRVVEVTVKILEFEVSRDDSDEDYSDWEGADDDDD